MAAPVTAPAGPTAAAGAITCTHKGKPVLTSDAKLRVAGNPVMRFSAVATLGPYVGCPRGCSTTAVVTGGSASKLTVGGAAVLLDTLQATSAGLDPPANVTVDAGQTTLTAT